MTEKAQFDIPLVLPGVADAADACVERIIGRLKPRAGVDEVHVLPATADQPAKLCIGLASRFVRQTTLSRT